MAARALFRHLLVATNGSALSFAAMRTGVELARICGAPVTFVTSSKPFAPGPDDAFAEAHRGEYENAMNATARERLAQGEALALAPRVTAHTEHVFAGQPCDAILETAALRRCDLVVMASRGHRPLAGLLIGSQTLKVLTRSSVPVLVCAPGPTRPLRHILAATDGSAASEAAARAAIDLALLARARVTLVTCTQPVLELAISGDRASQVELAESSASRRFHAPEEYALEHGVRLACEHLYSQHPSRSILDCARTLDCDLVVMASQRRAGDVAMALGSETLKVLTHAQVPVLVWRWPSAP